MTSPLPAESTGTENSTSRQNQLIVVLADISGYTDLMVANQTTAIHGQMIVTTLIEAILNEVDIPLHLQEIEGDAVFLFAEHPGNDEQWVKVCAHVAQKLPRFIEAFAEALVGAGESTICRCAVCQTDELRLKIVVHSGEAVFHTIRGRAQISGLDVIIAHRLLKNSVPGHEYILLSAAAHTLLGPSLSMEFTSGSEQYSGIGEIHTYVHFPNSQEEVRQKFYAQSSGRLALGGIRYSFWTITNEYKALILHLRKPVTTHSVLQRSVYAARLVLASPLFFVVLAVYTPFRLIRRRAHHHGSKAA